MREKLKDFCGLADGKVADPAESARLAEEMATLSKRPGDTRTMLWQLTEE